MNLAKKFYCTTGSTEEKSMLPSMTVNFNAVVPSAFTCNVTTVPHFKFRLADTAKTVVNDEMYGEDEEYVEDSSEYTDEHM